MTKRVLERNKRPSLVIYPYIQLSSLKGNEDREYVIVRPTREPGAGVMTSMFYGDGLRADISQIAKARQVPDM
jgi:hypothetical protein